MVNKNNMKRIFLFFMIFVNVLYFSQKRFNGYFVNSSIGTLQKEYSNIKISTNNFQGIIGKEFLLSNHISLLGGISLENMYSNYVLQGSNYNLNSKYIGIPVWFRWYDSTENLSTLFVGLGIINRLTIKETIENLSLNTSTNGSNGYHMTSYAEIGFRTKLKETMDAIIGLNYGSDFIKSNTTKITNNANIFLAFEVFKNQNQ